MKRYNPFKPGSIVGPGMFSGRIEELNILERVLFQTKNGNPQHFLIQGERGIGKSSLLFYFNYVASGELESSSGDSFKFLTVNIELEPSNNYFDIIRKVGAELRRVVASNQRAMELVKTAWDFLKRWEVLGVKYSERDRAAEPHELLDELTHTVEQTVSAMGTEFDGILILIDEADKPPPKANLGEFIKIFTERLTKRGCNKVSLGMAGLSGVIRKLRESHESSPRIFEILSLEPLLKNERVQVVRRGLAISEEKNGYKTEITPDAENWISVFSEGYPHFIQQFAYSAFEEDNDNNIDTDDVGRGALKENGAFQQLGLKYFHEQYYDQIGADEYRDVLRFMASHIDDYVTKQDIRDATGIKETTLTNAIKALRDRKIIIPMEGKKGVYRLPTKSFAVWIKSFTGSPPTSVTS
ncbi:MAG: ATP-binding protein [Nitrospinae bacterium]|nr:ATP-binding protein [Nitrospinota bacterium]